MEEACVYSLGELGQVCSPIEKVELTRVHSGQQRAWPGLRAHSTASLLCSWQCFVCFVPGLDDGIRSREFGWGPPGWGF